MRWGQEWGFRYSTAFNPQMISDPEVVVSCDQCQGREYVTPEFKFRDYSGNNGFYDCDDDAIEEQLPSEWVCENEKQFCSQECADAYEAK